MAERWVGEGPEESIVSYLGFQVSLDVCWVSGCGTVVGEVHGGNFLASVPCGKTELKHVD